MNNTFYILLAACFAVALSSCHTAAAVATIADQAVADKIKTNAAEPSNQTPSVADSSKPAEPVPQSNVSQNDNANTSQNNNQSSSNNSSNNVNTVSPDIKVEVNNAPVNINHTFIISSPEGTKVKEVEQVGDTTKVQLSGVAQTPQLPQTGKSVYVESNHKELKSKVSSHITKHGCVLIENTETAAMTLNMDYEECDKKTGNMGKTSTFTCKVCVGTKLQNRINGTSPYENVVENIDVWANSMEEACAMALKPIPNKIWEEIKGKIGDCK